MTHLSAQTNMVAVLQEILEHPDSALEAWRVVCTNTRESFNRPEGAETKGAFLATHCVAGQCIP